jgi:hypothetical protein
MAAAPSHSKMGVKETKGNRVFSVQNTTNLSPLAEIHCLE